LITTCARQALPMRALHWAINMRPRFEKRAAAAGCHRGPHGGGGQHRGRHAGVVAVFEQEALEQALTGNPMTPTQVWTATPGQ